VLWEVVTEDTVIFPEGTSSNIDESALGRELMTGGGQPTDTGHLSTLDPNGGIQKIFVVEGCLRRKLTAVHLVRLGEGEGEELESGGEVELTIDWDRRADHVSLHLRGRLTSRWQSTLPSIYCPLSSIHTNYRLYHGQ
jgi:hypothetical protein